MSHPNKAYLGDGAYIQEGSFRGEFLITAEDGISVQNSVTLSEHEMATMLRWLIARGLLDPKKLINAL